VLRRVVEAAKESIRTIDIPGRIGGDEFAVILPGADETAARRAGQGLGASIAALSLRINETPVPVTASIGVASLDRFRPRIPTIEELLSAADSAMYRAKRSGKNRVE
jgi:diguanylate cyclase (GGDEF)-like protein